MGGKKVSKRQKTYSTFKEYNYNREIAKIRRSRKLRSLTSCFLRGGPLAGIVKRLRTNGLKVEAIPLHTTNIGVCRTSLLINKKKYLVRICRTVQVKGKIKQFVFGISRSELVNCAGLILFAEVNGYESRTLVLPRTVVLSRFQNPGTKRLQISIPATVRNFQTSEWSKCELVKFEDAWWLIGPSQKIL